MYDKSASASAGRIKDPDRIQEMLATHKTWYHRIELLPGIFTPGTHDSQKGISQLDEIGLPRDCKGLRVLDIGCRDGFFAFEMEKRGAAEVVGVDYVVPEGTGFSIASRILDSRVQYIVSNVYDLSPEKLGTFDVVLFLGVLYHLRNPMLALDRIRTIMKDGGKLLVETRVIDDAVRLPDGTMQPMAVAAPKLADAPIMQFYPRDELNKDETNKWAPNLSCLKYMVEEAEFRVDATAGPIGARGFVRATAVRDHKINHFRRRDCGSGFACG
jgi:tRNA (mo5U34)-methyltransferase